mmetsp:Transcript_39150/g.51633  ORF Transcript_39150/g.51633 Transcript_39150/m.51633 type:complete len:234 (-) Transcript_39150:435-1136(-)
MGLKHPWESFHSNRSKWERSFLNNFMASSRRRSQETKLFSNFQGSSTLRFLTRLDDQPVQLPSQSSGTLENSQPSRSSASSCGICYRSIPKVRTCCSTQTRSWSNMKRLTAQLNMLLLQARSSRMSHKKLLTPNSVAMVSFVLKPKKSPGCTRCGGQMKRPDLQKLLATKSFCTMDLVHPILLGFCLEASCCQKLWFQWESTGQTADGLVMVFILVMRTLRMAMLGLENAVPE